MNKWEFLEMIKDDPDDSIIMAEEDSERCMKGPIETIMYDCRNIKKPLVYFKVSSTTKDLSKLMTKKQLVDRIKKIPSIAVVKIQEPFEAHKGPFDIKSISRCTMQRSHYITKEKIICPHCGEDISQEGHAFPTIVLRYERDK